MIFRRLWNRGRDRARSSERRRLDKAFQKDGPTTAKDGPTTAKLLRWAVASLTLGTTRSPCSAERRDLGPAEMIPGHRAPLDKPGPGLACKTVAHEHQDLKGNTPMHRQPAQFRTDELGYMPELRNPTNQSSSSIQNRLQLINMRQRKLHYNNLLLNR